MLIVSSNPAALTGAQEVDGIGHSEVGPADLVDMPYLDACLKEAMRLYPPGVFTIRQPLTEDFEIKGWTIPKGTWIHVRFAPVQRSLYLERLPHSAAQGLGRTQAHASSCCVSGTPLLMRMTWAPCKMFPDLFVKL